VANLEIIQDWEVQPVSGTFGARAARPPPPESQPFIRSLSTVARSILDAGVSVTSRVSTQMMGGIERFLVNAVSAGAAYALPTLLSRPARALMPAQSIGRFADRFSAVE